MMSFGEWVPQFVGMVGAMASSAMDAKFNFRWDHCGVGAVLGFLPQLAVLFLCLGF